MAITQYSAFVVLTVCCLSIQATNVTFSPSSIDVEIGQSTNVSLKFREPLTETVTVYFTYQFGDKAESYVQSKEVVVPLDNQTLLMNTTETTVTIIGHSAGSVIVGINTSVPLVEDLEQTYVKVSVVHSKVLDIITIVIGWIYFVAWSVSFYPQVILNFTRKSVVGLNFDFLAFNLTGFIAYGLFNVGMYWIPAIWEQYHAQHPRGVNPVLLNDVIFTLHAIFITAVTIVQCCIYEREGQRVSRLATGILAVMWLVIAVMLVVTLTHLISWLFYLYLFSYIKLIITLIKYIPQAYMNYQRKSTDGWSIGNVLLDATGGSFSLLQMFLLAYNNDDWGSIFGDPTKFGLGAFSILFDILFVVQHYVLYRNKTPYQIVLDVPPQEDDEDENPSLLP